MRIIIFIASIFFVTASHTQNIIYGLPSLERELDVDNLIIINVPNHVDGRVIPSTELDDLRAFLQYHSNVSFNLSLHIFGGSSDFCQDYSDFLSKSLEKHLNCRNVDIEGRGNNGPLFLDEKSERYFILNTRVEIVTKEENDP